MARLLLSKSELLAERRRLAAYQRFVPSLQMKRQQLMAAVNDSRRRLQQGHQALQQTQTFVANELPLLADTSLQLDALLTDNGTDYHTVNIAGVRIQQVARVNIDLPLPSLLTRPAWVLSLQQKLADAVTQLRHNEAEEKALQRLNHELTRVTQRVNLFEKVLIPEAQGNIRKIQIFLDDKAREAVVTSKIAKKKNLEKSA